MDLDEPISARVRILLAERGLSAAELARRLDWTQQYMARRMAGRVAWRTTELAAIAAELEIEPAELLLSGITT